MPKPKKLETVAELFAEHESLRDRGKALYEQADGVLKKLVRTWEKNKSAIAHIEKDKKTGSETKFSLEIEDQFRGTVKAFAPAFAHRYKLKLQSVTDSD